MFFPHDRCVNVKDAVILSNLEQLFVVIGMY